MKANRESRFWAPNQQLFYLVVYTNESERNSYSEAPVWGQWLTSRSWGLTFYMLGGAEPEGKWGDLRAGAEASLASQSAEQGRCWPPWGLLACYFQALEGLTGHCVCREQALRNACTGSTPALCQPYAVFFLWHPNTNVWVFAWLMRSYIRKASVGNIYKQANFLNENVLWISFLRRKKKNCSPGHWS